VTVVPAESAAVRFHCHFLLKYETFPLDQNQDIEHLRLLSIFHFVVAGIIGLISLFPLIHVAIGAAIVMGLLDDSGTGEQPPPLIGWLFIVFPLAMIIIGMAMAICIFVAGRRLGKQTGYQFCLIVAGIECLFMPFGTVLGVFTILVLLRPSVKLLFDVSGSAMPPGQ
jgi:hypothetical protein